MGESKAYNRECGGFRDAVLDSVNDVINHYGDLRNEMKLYLFDKNIPEGLDTFFQEYLKGEHNYIKINLVCMISYNRNIKYDQQTIDEFKEYTSKLIEEDFNTLNEQDYNDLDKINLEKIIYIVFPINNMNEIIMQFQREIGV